MSTARSRTETSVGVSALQPRTSGIEPAALWTLFTLTLRQFLRGKRLLVLGVLALLPAGLAILTRLLDSSHPPPPSEIAFVFLFNLIPHVLLPLTALLYASGMILDEQEEQTLTYLLVRPLPKWALYVTKLLATMCMVAILGFVMVVATYLAAYLGSGQFFQVFPLKMLGTIVVMTLALMTYTAVFGCMSLMIQRSMIAGIIYISAIEGLMANLDFAVRRLTVMYYFRVLSLRWLDLDRKMSEAWSIHLSDTPPKMVRGMVPQGMADAVPILNVAPDALTCVLTLLAVIVLATFLAARIFSSREFYVKTPESN